MTLFSSYKKLLSGIHINLFLAYYIKLNLRKFVYSHIHQLYLLKNLCIEHLDHLSYFDRRCRKL